jgi:hypothetical protein
MQEVPRPTHQIQDEPVDLFYKAIKAQERLQREYLDYRLANVSAPFSEATKRQIWEWQRQGKTTRWIADELKVTRYKIHLLVKRTSWPAPTNLA